MKDFKNCLFCSTTFERPANLSKKEWPNKKYCSRACHYADRVNHPSPKKGRQYPSKRPKQIVPCRICGEPTRYPGGPNSALVGKIACEREDCVERSRLLKNERIQRTHTTSYANGSRAKIHHAWDKVERISETEREMESRMRELGWTPQYRVLTGVKTNRLPRQYVLDFALPERKLCVEIDGSVHRLTEKQKQDRRRDEMLTQLGWKTLRLSDSLVRNRPDMAFRHIIAFATIS